MNPPSPSPASPTPDVGAAFDAGLAKIAAKERQYQGRRGLWLAHHWPESYADRCVHIGGRWVCRRCAALYPMGIFIAVLSAVGYPPWPPSIDPWPIWLLCLPATLAYCLEALGLIRYRARQQTAAMIITAVGFGRGLGYELNDRWSPEFWGPVAVFGGLWFFATVIGLKRRRPK